MDEYQLQLRIQDRGGASADIRERSYQFAADIVRLCRYLEKTSEVPRAVTNQLLRAGTSIGANLEEAQAGQSKSDFVHKNSISLKEARESRYWLRLILETADFQGRVKTSVERLRDEFWELALIIGKIIVNAKQRSSS
ncbi:MAG: four helix bundle protein [Acidobacteria bacterium]|nr:four helix bundle protein [Acidobacteriota bacterium]